MLNTLLPFMIVKSDLVMDGQLKLAEDLITLSHQMENFPLDIVTSTCGNVMKQ